MATSFFYRSTSPEKRIRSAKIHMMEINDIRMIEIFHTLEKIERVNQAIQFHKTMKEKADELAIEQYSSVKSELTEQLLQLLEEMDLHLQVSAA
jgi:hypothetical protein